DVIASVVSTLSPLADKYAVNIDDCYGTADLPPALADRTRLLQVLINLGSNAIKYNRPGGWVKFACGIDDAQVLSISVEDNGYGIPFDRQGEIFQPFNRLGAEQGTIEGSGIGLALARNLMEMMDGRLSFESIEGTGTTFWADLPIARAPAQKRHAPSIGNTSDALPEKLSGRMRVLYVEDNEDSKILLRSYLRLLPEIDLIEASDGLTGLRHAQTQHPDVIFLDINLPVMDGLAMLKALKQDPAAADIPVIAVSANALPAEIADALRQGFHHYLTKPARLGDVLNIIGEL